MQYLSRMCVECGKDVDLKNAKLYPNGQRCCLKRCAKKYERRIEREKNASGHPPQPWRK